MVRFTTDLQTGHLEDRDHARIFLLLFTMKLFCFFFRSIFPKKLFCVLARENLEAFSERCSRISGVLQGLVKICKKYMEVNHFLLLSCSLEKWLLVEWFFNYSTRRQSIVFLSSLVVLFEGNLLEWEQLFLRKFCDKGAIFLGGNYSGGNISRHRGCRYMPCNGTFERIFWDVDL